jgi:peroxin-6
MLKAITRQANAVDAKIKAIAARDGGEEMTKAYFFDHLATPEDVAVMVTEEDFLEAKGELVSSVSAKELEHYDRVRQQFEAKDAQDDKKKKKDKAKTKMPLLGGKLESRDVKGKGKAVDKGKGKAVNRSFDDDDYDEGTVRGSENGSANGLTNGKGKGKAVDRSWHDGGGFVDPSANDEEELYGE